jgi:hypothetical protein
MRQRKQKRKVRFKKSRGGLYRSYRAVTVSAITEEGFDLYFKEKQYHVSRDLYGWFRGASDDEIKDVRLASGNDHGEYWLIWESLDVWLGSDDFVYPERVMGLFNI